MRLFAQRDPVARTSSGACSPASSLWSSGKTTSPKSLASAVGRVARESGGLRLLPYALSYSAANRILRGEFGVAEQLLEEAETIRAATRGPYFVLSSVLLAAWRGDRETTNELREAAVEVGTARGEGLAIEIAEWATAVLHNGLGEYADAVAAAQRAYDLDVLGFGGLVLPELIEAAVRSGNLPAAEVAFARLVERSSTSTTEWARGIEAAARALLSEGPDAEAHYLEAVEQLGRSRVIVLHARAQLTYGEWLRREGRRVDAREQLKAAHTAFEAMGARGFAERARHELAATGETVRKRSDDTRGRPHAAGGADRPPRVGPAHEPRDRCAALPQPAHRRVPPAQGVPEARHQLAQGARESAVRFKVRTDSRLTHAPVGSQSSDRDPATTSRRRERLPRNPDPAAPGGSLVCPRQRRTRASDGGDGWVAE